MTEETEPRKPSRLWKWTRRVIVWLFLLQTVLVVAVLIYAAYWNRRGPRELAAAVKRCRDQALLEDRRSVYSRAAGKNTLGPMYTAAFATAPDMRSEEYKDLPYFADEGPVVGQTKPISPEVADKLRKFAAGNRDYFHLLETALDAGAKLPLIDWDAVPLSERSWMSRTMDAVRHYLLLSLLAQAEGKPAEAMAACEKAVSIGGIMDGQSCVEVGLIRSGCGAIAAGGIEDALSRLQPEATDSTKLRSAVLEQADRIDLCEAAKGELSVLAENAASPDLCEFRQAHSTWKLARALMNIASSEGDAPLTDVPSTFFLTNGISWTWYALCPGSTQATMARALDQAREGCGSVTGTPADIARWAKSLVHTRAETVALFPPRVALLMLRTKAGLRAAAAGLSVEQYRLRNGRWPEKLADVPGPMPSDLFTGKPMKFARTDDGCMIYSVGENLTDDGGKERYPDGDDVVFRLFDPDKRNRP